MAQRQIHLWVTESEHDVIHELAVDRGDNVTSFVLRLVRAYRLLYPDTGPGGRTRPSPPVETGPRTFG